MTELRIIEMDHIVLNVGDIERSIAFYTEILGLRGERLEEFRKGRSWVPFGPDKCGHFDRPDEYISGRLDGPKSRNLNHYCLVTQTMDLAELADGLKAQGVTVVREPVSRWGAKGQATSIYILDPDENEIEIRCY